jgi:cytoskeleton protein RodZ
MAPQRASGDFGSRLREARERRDVSLRQIANATKISVTVLEALERNDISRLPGGIFSRAFVRSYASEVGLDPEETVHEFMEAFPEDSVAQGHPTAMGVEDSETIESERRTATTFLQLIAWSVPVLTAVWFFGASVRRPAPAPEPAPVATSAGPEEPADSPAAPPLTAPPPAPGATPPRSAPASPSVMQPPAGTPLSKGAAGIAVPAANPSPAEPNAPEPAPVGRLVVGLSVKRPCWISATVDGERAIERLVRPGEERNIEVQREFVLTAGDAAAVALTINGAEARPLGKLGQVVTARLNLANFRDYLRTP